MSPLKLSYKIDDKGINEVTAEDGVVAQLKTPAGEAFARSNRPRFPWIKGPFKIITDIYFGRGLTTRFPSDSTETPCRSCEFGDREVTRVLRIKNTEGTVTIKAVSSPEK